MDKERVVYPYNGVLFNLLKKEVQPFMRTWRNLVLSDISQSERDTYSRVPLR